MPTLPTVPHHWEMCIRKQAFSSGFGHSLIQELKCGLGIKEPSRFLEKVDGPIRAIADQVLQTICKENRTGFVVQGFEIFVDHQLYRTQRMDSRNQVVGAEGKNSLRWRLGFLIAPLFGLPVISVA